MDWRLNTDIMLAVATICLVIVAWKQLQDIKNIAKAHFIKKLNDSFFTYDTRDFITLNSAIRYTTLLIQSSHCWFKQSKVIDELPYFEIDLDILNQLKRKGLINLPEWRKGYSAFEIDDILGLLDDVGGFEKAGRIDILEVERVFGYYIIEIVENKSIEDYMKQEKNFDDLQLLYQKIKCRKWQRELYKK